MYKKIYKLTLIKLGTFAAGITYNYHQGVKFTGKDSYFAD